MVWCFAEEASFRGSVQMQLLELYKWVQIQNSKYIIASSTLRSTNNEAAGNCKPHCMARMQARGNTSNALTKM